MMRCAVCCCVCVLYCGMCVWVLLHVAMRFVVFVLCACYVFVTCRYALVYVDVICCALVCYDVFGCVLLCVAVFRYDVLYVVGWCCVFGECVL